MCCMLVYVFFFKQKTAYEMRISDWSSDVCSSDLQLGHGGRRPGDGIRPGADRVRQPGGAAGRRDHRQGGFDELRQAADLVAQPASASEIALPEAPEVAVPTPSPSDPKDAGEMAALPPAPPAPPADRKSPRLNSRH